MIDNLPAMTPNIVLPLLTSLCATIALMASDFARFRPGRYIFKPIAATAFIWLALALDATTTLYGQWMLVGLVLCFAGDIFLMPDSERSFLLGLTAFLLGHLCYTVAFATHSWAPATVAISIVPVALLVYATLRWLRPHLDGAMRLGVPGYIAVIALMLLAAAMTVHSPRGAAVICGALGFALSDLAVARQQFVSPARLNPLWGTPLYFASQMLLALSIGIAVD